MPNKFLDFNHHDLVGNIAFALLIHWFSATLAMAQEENLFSD